jgi:hypothetical protein
MKKLVFAGLLPALLGGCSVATLPEVLPAKAASDAQLASKNTTQTNVIGDFTPRNAVEPKPWRISNDAQSPTRGGSAR